MSPTSAPDQAIAALATRQHGVVARTQLIGIGLTARAVDRRIAGGRLHVVHRGVYAVGHAMLSQDGRWMAAVLACGHGSALSHRSAAELHGFRRTEAVRVDVAVPDRRCRRHAGITAHRPTDLRPDDVTEIRGIPVTVAVRTLIDLAEVVVRRQLERACDAAERARAVDWSRVIELLDRQPERRGARRLRRLLTAHGIRESRTSELEERFLRFCERHRLARPEVNAVVAGHEVDFSWPLARLIVETDGDEYHRTRVARERDRRRDAALTVAGWRVSRTTGSATSGARCCGTGARCSTTAVDGRHRRRPGGAGSRNDAYGGQSSPPAAPRAEPPPLSARGAARARGP